MDLQRVECGQTGPCPGRPEGGARELPGGGNTALISKRPFGILPGPGDIWQCLGALEGGGGAAAGIQWTEARVEAATLECAGQLLTGRMIWPQMSAVLRLRSPGLGRTGGKDTPGNVQGPERSYEVLDPSGRMARCGQGLSEASRQAVICR